MKKKRKIQKEFEFDGFGIPLVLVDAPMVVLRGEWTLDVNFNQLEDALAMAVALKPSRLSGDEVRLLRLHLGHSFARFGEIFSRTKQAAMKWEKSKKEQTCMAWATEKDLRMHVVVRHDVSSEEYKRIHLWLENARKEDDAPVRLTSEEISDQQELIDRHLAEL